MPFWLSTDDIWFSLNIFLLGYCKSLLLVTRFWVLSKGLGNVPYQRGNCHDKLVWTRNLLFKSPVSYPLSHNSSSLNLNSQSDVKDIVYWRLDLKNGWTNTTFSNWPKNTESSGGRSVFNPRPLSVCKVAGWSPPGEHGTNSGWTRREIRARPSSMEDVPCLPPRPLPVWKVSVRKRCVNRNRKSKNEHISSRFVLFLYDNYA